MWKNLSTCVLIAILSLGLSSCFLRPYRMDIQQGNIITPKMAAKVRRGMSASRVQQILGTPVLRNIFYNNQLIYVYTMQPGYKKMYKNYTIIYFRNGRVRRIDTNVNEIPTLPEPKNKLAKK